MWRIGLIVFSLLVLSGSAFAHDLIFDLPHQHDSNYYAERYHREFERARTNFITTGDPRYMIPYLGWPRNNSTNYGNTRVINVQNRPTSTTRQR